MFDSSAPSRRVDVSTPPFAKQIFVCEQESEAATNSHAKGCERTCPRQDSNLYALSGTGPSNQPVYQFQHVGNARGGTRTPTGFPPQDPESCASTNSATRARVAPPEDATRNGAEGSRTPDLLNAIQALSQLSYGPVTMTTWSSQTSRTLLSGADGTRTRGLRCDRPAL